MTLGIIIAIIILGLVLIFVEMFVLPGTALFGILGGVAIVTGVVLVYHSYDSKWGNIASVSAVIAFAITIVAGFKAIQSNKISMKAEIRSKVNEVEKHRYKVGDKGTAVSELRPNGKALFDDDKVDVYSNGEYIQRGSELEISKITNDKIFVKQI